MSRGIYNLRGEPTGEAYRQLLSHALHSCDTFLLVIRPSVRVHESAKDVLRRLAPFLLSATEESEWPGTKLLDAKASVYRFRLCEETVSVLDQAAPGLYSWVQPQLPEDLCLMRGDATPWLVSIAHERDAYLLLSSEEQADLLIDVAGLALEET